MPDTWPNWALYLCWLALAVGLVVLIHFLGEWSTSRRRQRYLEGLGQQQRRQRLEDLQEESRRTEAKFLHPSHPHWIDQTVEEIRSLSSVPYDWRTNGE